MVIVFNFVFVYLYIYLLFLFCSVFVLILVSSRVNSQKRNKIYQKKKDFGEFPNNAIPNINKKVVFTTILLVCFLSLLESTCETRKNVFYFIKCLSIKQETYFTE